MNYNKFGTTTYNGIKNVPNLLATGMKRSYPYQRSANPKRIRLNNQTTNLTAKYTPQNKGSKTEIKSNDVNDDNLTNQWVLPAIENVAGVAVSLGTLLSATATGGMLAVNYLSEGSSSFGRIGSKVQMTSLKVSFDYKLLEVGTALYPSGVSQSLRVAIVYDRQPNGNYPLIGDIFADNGSSCANVTSLTSGINISNKERFLVLRDEIIPLQYYNLGRNHYSTYIKRKLDTNFGPESGSIADIKTGAIYVILGSSLYTANNAFNICIENFHSRYRFSD